MSDPVPDDPVLPSTSDGTSPGGLPARPEDVLPGELHLLPLVERPFFPAQAVPVLMNDAPWLETIQGIGETHHHCVGLVLVDTDVAEQARPEHFRTIGTVARVHHAMHNAGKVQFIAEGLRRLRIRRLLTDRPPYMAQVEYPDDILENEDQLKAYAIAIINTLKELVPHNPLYSEELKHFLSRFNPNQPSALTDFAASLTTAERTDLQSVLETIPVLERMHKVLVLIRKELEVARLQAGIREQVEEKLNEQQRRFFLREQLKAIQKELGLAKDDREADAERLRARMEQLSPPDAVAERFEDEMDKLAVLEAGSPEYAVTRNYLDWLTQVPWGMSSEDNLALDHGRAVLDAEHDGLEDVKERIIEFLALAQLRGSVEGSILLLVGPPGVGKTSIGRGVARALGRRFYRFSLGGMRDEAEIKGHRRTYIGALPGKLTQALKECRTDNPVLMLDEIDKLGASFRGDPASALLEVLDPEQNNQFLDHYLDLRLDLSRVLFIATANTLDPIPGPLLDRMEVIRLAGYIAAEKLAIARHHLWPRLLERAGLRPGQLGISDAALRQVIDGYAREAGVRNLEKQLGRIIRKVAVGFVRGEYKRLRIGPRALEPYLGKPLFRRERPGAGIGVVTGLAWTALGGATLSVEAVRVHNQGRGLKVTGQLGEVMQESAAIALSHITAQAPSLGVDPAYFSQAFIHLHVPEGATPKDGPSAGITMATALLSLARGQRIRQPLAMTGELTLTGQVLAVGGIREKVIAARRAGIRRLILPEANRRDFEELADHLREDIDALFVRRYHEVGDSLFPTH